MSTFDQIFALPDLFPDRKTLNLPEENGDLRSGKMTSAQMVKMADDLFKPNPMNVLNRKSENSLERNLPFLLNGMYHDESELPAFGCMVDAFHHGHTGPYRTQYRSMQPLGFWTQHDVDELLRMVLLKPSLLNKIPRFELLHGDSEATENFYKQLDHVARWAEEVERQKQIEHDRFMNYSMNINASYGYHEFGFEAQKTEEFFYQGGYNHADRYAYGDGKELESIRRDSPMSLANYESDSQSPPLESSPEEGSFDDGFDNVDSSSPETDKDSEIKEQVPQIDYHLLDKSKSYECAFCRGNNQSEEVYKSHPIRLEKDVVFCPYLREHVCFLCKATGDKAHTIKYCPQNKRGFLAMPEKFPPKARKNSESIETSSVGFLSPKVDNFSSLITPPSANMQNMPRLSSKKSHSHSTSSKAKPRRLDFSSMEDDENIVSDENSNGKTRMKRYSSVVKPQARRVIKL